MMTPLPSPQSNKHQQQQPPSQQQQHHHHQQQQKQKQPNIHSWLFQSQGSSSLFHTENKRKSVSRSSAPTHHNHVTEQYGERLSTSDMTSPTTDRIFDSLFDEFVEETVVPRKSSHYKTKQSHNRCNSNHSSDNQQNVDDAETIVLSSSHNMIDRHRDALFTNDECYVTKSYLREQLIPIELCVQQQDIQMNNIQEVQKNYNQSQYNDHNVISIIKNIVTDQMKEFQRNFLNNIFELKVREKELEHCNLNYIQEINDLKRTVLNLKQKHHNSHKGDDNKNNIQQHECNSPNNNNDNNCLDNNDGKYVLTDATSSTRELSAVTKTNSQDGQVENIDICSKNIKAIVTADQFQTYQDMLHRTIEENKVLREDILQLKQLMTLSVPELAKNDNNDNYIRNMVKEELKLIHIAESKQDGLNHQQQDRGVSTQANVTSDRDKLSDAEPCDWVDSKNDDELRQDIDIQSSIDDALQVVRQEIERCHGEAIQEVCKEIDKVKPLIAQMATMLEAHSDGNARVEQLAQIIEKNSQAIETEKVQRQADIEEIKRSIQINKLDEIEKNQRDIDEKIAPLVDRMVTNIEYNAEGSARVENLVKLIENHSQEFEQEKAQLHADIEEIKSSIHVNVLEVVQQDIDDKIKPLVTQMAKILESHTEGNVRVENLANMIENYKQDFKAEKEQRQDDLEEFKSSIQVNMLDVIGDVQQEIDDRVKPLVNQMTSILETHSEGSVRVENLVKMIEKNSQYIDSEKVQCQAVLDEIKRSIKDHKLDIIEEVRHEIEDKVKPLFNCIATLSRSQSEGHAKVELVKLIETSSKDIETENILHQADIGEIISCKQFNKLDIIDEVRKEIEEKVEPLVNRMATIVTAHSEGNARVEKLAKMIEKHNKDIDTEKAQRESDIEEIKCSVEASKRETIEEVRQEIDDKVNPLVNQIITMIESNSEENNRVEKLLKMIEKHSTDIDSEKVQRQSDIEEIKSSIQASMVDTTLEVRHEIDDKIKSLVNQMTTIIEVQNEGIIRIDELATSFEKHGEDIETEKAQRRADIEEIKSSMQTNMRDTAGEVQQEIDDKVKPLVNQIATISKAHSEASVRVENLEKIIQKHSQEFETEKVQRQAGLAEIKSSIEVNILDTIGEVQKRIDDKIKPLVNQMTTMLQSHSEGNVHVEQLAQIIEKHSKDIETEKVQRQAGHDEVKSSIQANVRDATEEFQRRIDDKVEPLVNQIVTLVKTRSEGSLRLENLEKMVGKHSQALETEKVQRQADLEEIKSSMKVNYLEAIGEVRHEIDDKVQPLVNEVATMLETQSEGNAHVEKLIKIIERHGKDIETEKVHRQIDIEEIKSSIKVSKLQLDTLKVEINTRLSNEIISRAVNQEDLEKRVKDCNDKFDNHHDKILQVEHDVRSAWTDIETLVKYTQESSQFQQEVREHTEKWNSRVDALEAGFGHNMNELVNLRDSFSDELSQRVEVQKAFEECRAEIELLMQNLEIQGFKIQEVQEDLTLFQNSIVKSDSKRVMEANSILERIIAKESELQNAIDSRDDCLNGIRDSTQADLRDVTSNWTDQFERLERQVENQYTEIQEALKDRELIRSHLEKKEVELENVNKALESTTAKLQESQWENRGLKLSISGLKQKQNNAKKKFDELIRNHSLRHAQKSVPNEGQVHKSDCSVSFDRPIPSVVITTSSSQASIVSSTNDILSPE